MKLINHNVKNYDFKPFEAIGEKWCLLTSVKDGKINTMTVNWGGVGVLWHKNVVTVYVRPERYTREFIDDSDYFTLTFFDGYKDELKVLGTKSGRDCDKIKEVGFNLVELDNGYTFEEGKTVFSCKKLFKSQMKEDNFIDKSICSEFYKNEGYHIIYIGEIINIAEIEK